MHVGKMVMLVYVPYVKVAIMSPKLVWNVFRVFLGVLSVLIRLNVTNVKTDTISLKVNA